MRQSKTRVRNLYLGGAALYALLLALSWGLGWAGRHEAVLGQALRVGG